MSNINHLRNQMDEVTLEMIKLLKKRTDIAQKIGEIKKNIGKGVTDEIRETTLRKKVVDTCKQLGLEESIGTKFLNYLLNESVKIQSTGKKTHLSIFLKAKDLEKHGKKIIHMEVGEPDFLPPITVKKALCEVYDKKFLRYGPAKGIPEFREEIAKFVTKNLKIKLREDNVLVSPGARFAIFLSISTLLNPGDEIIVIEPAWPAYRDCAENAGIKVRSIQTNLTDKWEPSIKQIVETINSNTKMIILNYPNNPTGKILPKKIQDEIMKIAIENNLFVLSDEIYSQYAYSPWKSVLEYNYEKSIITQSFSKSHAMTGFRIGYVMSSPEIIENLAKLQALCLTNVAEPIQYVAMKALLSDTSENKNIIKSRLDVLTESASKLGLEFVKPDGAMYIFAKVKDGFDSTKFCQDLLKEGIALAPGEGFGNYKEFVRISACLEEKTLIEGMNKLNKILGDKNG